MKTNGIYIIRNLINNKRYIGSSVSITTRWKSHKSRLNRNKHHSDKLQNSWNKHGAANFAFEIVEILPEFLSEKQVRGIEQFFITTSNWDNLYNIADNVSCTYPNTETKKKMINSRRARSTSQGIQEYKRKNKTAYRVVIGRDSVYLYIGTYDTYEEALIARTEAEEKYWVRNEPYEKPNRKTNYVQHTKKSGSGIYQQKDGTYRTQFYINKKLKTYTKIATYEEALKIRLDLEAKYWTDKPV